MGTNPKALWNLLHFHCYLDDICMTPQMAEPRSWQWPGLGCELRHSVAFEPQYWLHSKPIYPWEKLIKGSKIFWLYNELHVTRGRGKRQAGAKWLPSTEPWLPQGIPFLSQQPFMGKGRDEHSCLSSWEIYLSSWIVDTGWDNEETPCVRTYHISYWLYWIIGRVQNLD